MKKIMIAVSSVVLVVTLVVMVLLCRPRFAYEVAFEEKFVVENGVAPEKMEYIIELTKEGGYMMHGDWALQPSGMVIGFEIEDENGEAIRWFSAGEIDWNTDVIELTAGKYTMTLTPITDVESWRGFYRKFDTSEWEIPVEESEPEIAFADGEYKLDFAFKLQTTGDLQALACVLGAIIGVVFCVILYAVTQKDNSMKQNYDERQELNRGRGAKYGIYTMFFLDMVLLLMEEAGMRLPMSAGLALFISAMVGGGVFAVYCVWKEAYYALNQKANVFTLFIFVAGIINLVIGIKAFAEGVAIQDNQLTIRSLNLFCAIMLLVICGALILKKVFRDREEE